MNQERLQQIFKQYIDRFEELNTKNREIYKWEIAAEFQNFDVDAPDFIGMLSHMQRVMENILDNRAQLPFAGLVDCAKQPGGEAAVREMFRALYAQEKRTVPEKQAAIDSFLTSYEELRQQYFPDSWRYRNDQRSVMTYLFFRYPNTNYGYKAQQAKRFADCVEFYEDWGSINDFRLDVYERMCDQFVEEIKKNDVLIKTHLSRYENAPKPLHPDENLHILAFDIIYCSQAYDFYCDMTFNPINAKARNLYFERAARAKVLEEQLEKAERDNLLFNEAMEYIGTCFAVGSSIRHKGFGDGIVEALNELNITVRFANRDTVTKLGIVTCLKQNFLVFLSAEVEKRLKAYLPILDQKSQIAQRLKRATEELQPYQEFLND